MQIRYTKLMNQTIMTDENPKPLHATTNQINNNIELIYEHY